MANRAFSEGGSLATLDVGRVEKVLALIWREYCANFEVQPIPEIQELRAHSLLWASLFIPEAISDGFVNGLIEAVAVYQEREDYRHSGWFRLGPIEAALYALTGEDSWLSTLRANLDHHSSSLREMNIEAFAMVSDRVEFDSETMRRISHNIESRHMFYDWPVILFAVSKGSSLDKKQKIEGWLNSFKMNDRTILEKLARGEWVENPFLALALEIHQYLLIRLACALPEEVRQLNLDDEWAPGEPGIQANPGTAEAGVQQLDLFTRRSGERPSGDLSDLAWDRIRAHPLMQSMIQISDQQ